MKLTMPYVRVRAIPRRRCTHLSMVLLAIALTALGAGAYAQDLEPRAYVNTPVGLNFLIAGYGYTAGGVATDPALPLQNAHLQVHSAILAYARSLDVWGRSGKVDVVLPYAWLSGTAEVEGQPRERDVSGFADPRLRFSVNLYGAPALSLQEFARYRQDLIIGASLQVAAPLGQYNATKLVNIGTNRWSFKPELGISKAWGPLTLELATGVTLYTDNHDFFGGKTRAQAPIYSVQGHVSYSLGAGIWAALDGTYYTGGRTTVDGVEGNDLQKNARLGMTVALPVNRHLSVKLYGSTGVSTRTGSDFDAVGLFLQYRWGGGL
jgi:Putative MetA-pathway of phenol degradation